MVKYAAGLIFFAGLLGFSQTTQGLIAGRILDRRTGTPLLNATLRVTHNSLPFSISIPVDSRGFFALPGAPPGVYLIRAEAADFQPLETRDVRLSVAGRLELTFRLRPARDVLDSARRSRSVSRSQDLVTVFGPDFDASRAVEVGTPRITPGTLESTIAYVVEGEELDVIPLNGRDAYALIVAQPGFSADSATSFGLGLAANGQRPTSSNFLLDGFENNNLILTGPRSALPPEAVQEYRISTNNFSAEFGRTAGFVANAVTPAATNRWRGLGYGYFQHQSLNANSFARNARGEPRANFDGQQAGFSGGGPIRDGLRLTVALDRTRTRGQGDATTVVLPSSSFGAFVAPGSQAARLIREFPAITVPTATGPIAGATVIPPAAFDRWTGLARADWLRGRHRVLVRYSTADSSNPEFFWSPYPDFSAPLEQNSHSGGVRIESAFLPRWTNEFRVGYSRGNLGWDRARRDIPTLIEALDQTVLPGSLQFYGFRSQSSTLEIGDSFTWVARNHLMKFGASLWRQSFSGALTGGADGAIFFENIQDFTIGRPRTLAVALDRTRLPAFIRPDFERDWRVRPFALFAQDTWRIRDGLTVNLGLRYESFGAPVTRVDTLVSLGEGANFPERIARASLRQASNEPLWAADRNDWQARIGISWSPGQGRWVARAAYGIFQDAPFGNLWQGVRSNGQTLASLALPYRENYDYLAPIDNQLPLLEGQRFDTSFPLVTLIDPRLRNGYVQSFFGGVEWRPHRSLRVEANGTGSLGRKLLTSDVVNRARLTNPALPEIVWRSSQGSSSFFSLQTAAVWTARSGFLRASYMWSHAIDNQSDPLEGEFFDLRFTRPGSGETSRPRSQFLQPYDSSADRGNSDFDQRHNLTVESSWNWRGFRVSQLAGFRSGLPYSVTFGDRRADLRSDPYLDRAAPGGRLLLDRDAFAFPGTGAAVGRNAFRGPGLVTVDLSLARDFRFEPGVLTVRADIYNALNHANLNNPEASLLSPDFGIATYGRRGRETGFPAAIPFTESPRGVQLMLRFQF